MIYFLLPNIINPLLIDFLEIKTNVNNVIISK